MSQEQKKVDRSLPILLGITLANLLIAIFIFEKMDSQNSFYSKHTALVTWSLIAGLLIQNILAVKHFKKVKPLAIFTFLSSPFIFLFSILVPVVGGLAWGRPLRIKNKEVHAKLTFGQEWTKGKEPSTEGLDTSTRQALETLWLHDAQKEHASVPAFSRISWLLVAAGAPPRLATWSHQAAIEEIKHAKLCFALAKGYGGRSHTVEPMPVMMQGGLDGATDALLTLAQESLKDGCQLEDYNADVALACAEACKEETTKEVLTLIAKEERGHANFSWSVLSWCLAKNPTKIRPAIEKSLKELAHYNRPTAVSSDKQEMVAKANAQQLRQHGRLPDSEWQTIWDQRLVLTKQRIKELLDIKQAA